MMTGAVLISLAGYGLVYRRMRMLAPDAADAYETGWSAGSTVCLSNAKMQ